MSQKVFFRRTLNQLNDERPRLNAVSLDRKNRTTTQPPSTPWVGFPHRPGEHSQVPIALRNSGFLGAPGASAAVFSSVALWRYPPAATAEPRPRLLMIHGFRGDHHGMQLVVDALPEFEILVPDLPGFGQTPPVRTETGHRLEHTVELYAEVLRALAEQLELGAEDVLIGHSFGTTVAAAHVASGQRGWAGLALSAPVSEDVFSGTMLPGAAMVELYYRVSRLLPEPAALALLRSPAALMMTNLSMGVEKNPQIRAYVRDQHRQHFGGFSDRRTLLEAYRASSRHTVADYAPRLRLPVALLPGAKDQVSTEPGRRRLRDTVPQCYMETIRGAGHLLHYEKPAQLARALRRFIDRL